MNHQAFADYCRGELIRTFENTKAGQPDERFKHRVEGLLQALQLLEIMSQEQIKAMIEQEHFRIFGESVAERRKRKSELSRIKAQSPDKYYEIPAVERKP